MFDSSSSNSNCKKDKSIDEIGDIDSGDDSEVVVFDTTAAVIAENISAGCDYIQRDQGCPGSAKRQRKPGIVHENQGRHISSARHNNSDHARIKQKNESKVSRHDDYVSMGRSAFEPIEIYDDSEDDETDCHILNGEGNGRTSVTKGTDACDGIGSEIATESTTTITGSKTSQTESVRKNKTLSTSNAEVINLMDEDDDSMIDFKSQKPEEVIDVDESESIELEVRTNKESKDKADANSRSKNSYLSTKRKPRFKPHNNKREKKTEIDPDSVRERIPLRTESRKCTPGESDAAFRPSNYQSKGARFNSHSQRCSSCFQENRFIFHPSNSKSEKNKFLGMNIEDALKEQERLLQKAADRIRNQPSFRVAADSSGSKKDSRSITFPSLVQNVHLRYPDHFKYCNFYSRLGLPRHANESMIKSQYRRLARVYHPDRNIGKPDTRHKFEAVKEAYNLLMNT